MQVVLFCDSFAVVYVYGSGTTTSTEANGTRYTSLGHVLSHSDRNHSCSTRSPTSVESYVAYVSESVP